MYPLDTVKTRLQALPPSEIKAETAENEKDARRPVPKTPAGLVRLVVRKLKRWQMLAMLVRIVRTEGIAGAFKGFSASMINTFSMRELESGTLLYQNSHTFSSIAGCVPRR